MRCEKCKFYVVDDGVCQCRLMPPLPVLIPVPQRGGIIAAKNEISFNCNMVYPAPKKDWWCGMYRPIDGSEN